MLSHSLFPSCPSLFLSFIPLSLDLYLPPSVSIYLLCCSCSFLWPVISGLFLFFCVGVENRLSAFSFFSSHPPFLLQLTSCSSLSLSLSHPLIPRSAPWGFGWSIIPFGIPAFPSPRKTRSHFSSAFTLPASVSQSFPSGKTETKSETFPLLYLEEVFIPRSFFFLHVPQCTLPRAILKFFCTLVCQQCGHPEGFRGSQTTVMRGLWLAHPLPPWAILQPPCHCGIPCWWSTLNPPVFPRCPRPLSYHYSIHLPFPAPSSSSLSSHSIPKSLSSHPLHVQPFPSKSAA